MSSETVSTETVSPAKSTESARGKKKRIKAEREHDEALVIDRWDTPEAKTATRALFHKRNPDPVIVEDALRVFFRSMPRRARGSLTQAKTLGELRGLRKVLDGLTVMQKALDGNNAAFRFLNKDAGKTTAQKTKGPVKKVVQKALSKEAASWYDLQQAVERLLKDHAHSYSVLQDAVKRAALELEKPRKELDSRTRRVVLGGCPPDVLADQCAKRAKEAFRILTGYNPYETVHDTKYDFSGFVRELFSILGIKNNSARRAFRKRAKKLQG